MDYNNYILHQYPAMALQPLAILIREQNAQGHCIFLVLLARTHRLACTNSLTSYLIYSPKMSKSSLKTGPQQEQEHGRKEEGYQGRKGGIDVSSPSGTSLWRERTRKTPPLRPDLELSCSPCLRSLWCLPRLCHSRLCMGLLRVRFLRNAVLPVEEERQPSVAARELGQLRQSHRVSTLRCLLLRILNILI